MKRLSILSLFLIALPAALGSGKLDPKCLGRGVLGAASGESAPGIDSLLARYRSEGVSHLSGAKRLEFTGVDGKTVYNPTAPFEIGGRRVMAARVESLSSERDSQVVFFEEYGGKWRPVSGAPRFNMQDPFHSKIWRRAHHRRRGDIREARRHARVPYRLLPREEP